MLSSCCIAPAEREGQPRCSGGCSPRAERDAPRVGGILSRASAAAAWLLQSVCRPRKSRTATMKLLSALCAARLANKKGARNSVHVRARVRVRARAHACDARARWRTRKRVRTRPRARASVCAHASTDARTRALSRSGRRHHRRRRSRRAPPSHRSSSAALAAPTITSATIASRRGTLFGHFSKAVGSAELRVALRLSRCGAHFASSSIRRAPASPAPPSQCCEEPWPHHRPRNIELRRGGGRGRLPELRRGGGRGRLPLRSEYSPAATSALRERSSAPLKVSAAAQDL